MFDLSNPRARALVLGGTVTVPPFPATATIRLASDGEIQQVIGGSDEQLIVIEQTIDPSTQIIRVVQARDLRAVFKPLSGDKVAFAGGTWNPGLPTEPGIAFVAEHAPVMTIAIFAGTATESADYCPPTCEKRCEGRVHWTLKDDTAPPK
jgi:hypothetical protein